jgi:hypothetical protein
MTGDADTRVTFTLVGEDDDRASRACSEPIGSS